LAGLQTRSDRLEQQGLRVGVLTFNVWGLPGWITGASSARHARIADELAQLDCDVVLLQEVWTRRSYGALSQEARNAPGPWWTAAARRPGAFLGQNGLLTLSRHPIVSSKFHPFATARFPDSLMRKGALRTTLAVSPGRFVNVWNTHLQHGSPRVRARQLQQLLRWVEASDQGQVADIVGGDFNLVPGSDEFAWLLAGVGPSVLALAGTAPFPTWDGRRGTAGGGKTIDHIFVRLRRVEGKVLAQAEPRFGDAVPEDRLSDHLGLEALLTFHGLEFSPLPALVSSRSSRPARAAAGVGR
jgi:endonuclease/exonuclease/phosphatase family metal-dependent hydrolase